MQENIYSDYGFCTSSPIIVSSDVLDSKYAYISVEFETPFDKWVSGLDSILTEGRVDMSEMTSV